MQIHFLVPINVNSWAILHFESFTNYQWAGVILFDYITLYYYNILLEEARTNRARQILISPNVAKRRWNTIHFQSWAVWKIYRYCYEIEPEDGAYLLFSRSFGDLEWSTCPALLHWKRGERRDITFVFPRINRFRKAATHARIKRNVWAVRRFKDHRLTRAHVWVQLAEGTITICIS